MRQPTDSDARADCDLIALAAVRSSEVCRQFSVEFQPFGISILQTNSKELLMNLKSSFSWFVAAIAPIALGAVAIIGCGKSGPERAPVLPVEGVVTFEGKSTPGAMIVLHRKGTKLDDVPAPRAVVGKDGAFRFTTYDAGDGVPAGEYVATIAWHKLTGQGSDIQAGPNVLPPRYGNPKTSTWEIRVADAPVRMPDVKLRR
jgi:hypothetical protein